MAHDVLSFVPIPLWPQDMVQVADLWNWQAKIFFNLQIFTFKSPLLKNVDKKIFLRYKLIHFLKSQKLLKKETDL